MSFMNNVFFRLKWCRTINPSSEDCAGVWAQLKAICRTRIVLNEKVEKAPVKYSGFCQKNAHIMTMYLSNEG